MDEKLTTGWIGLGAMGWPMAANLARAGVLDRVWNRSHEKAEGFAKQYGVNHAPDLLALAGACDIIFICVSADDDLNAVVEAMQPELKEGVIIVDHSTVSANTSRMLAETLVLQQVTFIDAPVSGGVEGAKNASLSVMAGGDEKALNTLMPLLQHMASRIIHMGAVGNGQATKAVNQIMAAGINQAVSEALAFGDAMGLDMEKVIEVVGSGAAANWFLSHRGHTMVKGEYDKGFKVHLHHKDLELCRRMMEHVRDSDKSLPLVEMTLIHYQRLMEAGFGDEDISSLHRLKKELFRD